MQRVNTTEAPDQRKPRPAPIDYSLVVCTRNRANDLREMLETALALETHSTFSYEIIVVDNNSTDETARIVKSLIPLSAGRLRYASESRLGKSYALNTALAMVRGHTYTIADDDFVLPHDWLIRIDHAFKCHPGAAYVSGKVLPRWLSNPPRWLTPDHWGPIALADYGEAETIADRGNRICLLACSFRIDPVRSVGGYDERLGVSGTRTGGTEDQDIQERLWEAGHHGVYTPDAHFMHKVPASRLTKWYHRRWHRHHGASYAEMGRDYQERSRFRMLGVPAHFFHRLLSNAIAAAVSRARGDESNSFSREAAAWFCIGFIAKRWASVLRSGRAQRAP